MWCRLVVAVLLVPLSLTVSQPVGADVRLYVPPLGEVVGTTTKSTWTDRLIYEFYSIKYAESPTGPLRFMPPVPVTSWNGVYNATYSRRGCPKAFAFSNHMQKIELNEKDEDVEDCLTLNVFTPISVSNGTLLPVMAYIHGGGYVEGIASDFPPNYLLEKDVVLVVIQYRLGPLGFLSLQSDGIAGNAGLMDQVEGLRWINKYIRYFGGDKNRVTVYGQSAGASSVTMHLFSPLVGDDLFHQMIVQSGSVFATWTLDEDPVPLVKDIYAIIANTTQEASNAVIEETLKSCTVGEIHNALNTILAFNPLRINSRPVVQKAGTKYLTVNPRDALVTGKFRTLPVMAGVTKHDGSFVLTGVYDIAEAFGLQNNPEYLRNNITKQCISFLEIKDVSNGIADIMTDKYFKELFDSKENVNFADVSAGLIDLLGVFVIKAPTLNFAKTNVQHNKQTYLYSMDYAGEYTRFGYGADTSKYPFKGGVHHSDDLLYLYPYPYTTALNVEDTKFAKKMVDLWTSFVITGKPSSPGSPEWLPLEKGKNGPYYHINVTNSVDDDFIHNEYMAATNEKDELPRDVYVRSAKSKRHAVSKHPMHHSFLSIKY